MLHTCFCGVPQEMQREAGEQHSKRNTSKPMRASQSIGWEVVSVDAANEKSGILLLAGMEVLNIKEAFSICAHSLHAAYKG